MQYAAGKFHIPAFVGFHLGKGTHLMLVADKIYDLVGVVKSVLVRCT